jgi:hypothetical protein
MFAKLTRYPELIRKWRSFLPGFGFVVIWTTAVATVLVFFGGGTSPDKNRGHAQHDHQRKKLLPVHGGNIAANRNRANGIFSV